MDLFVGPKINTIYPTFSENISFSRTTIRAVYSPADVDTISLTFSQKKRGW